MLKTGARVRLGHRIWIDGGDGKTFGRGPDRLLRGVEKTGSLRKAAAELGMSYNKAWWNIHTMEERLGFALLYRSVGGASGGGSRLTPEAVDLLARFDALEHDAGAALDALFAKYFGDFTAWKDTPPSAAADGETGLDAMTSVAETQVIERPTLRPPPSRRG